MSIEDYQQTNIINKEAYLSLFRKYREYYIHERNLALAGTAIFVFYVVYRFVEGIALFEQKTN